MVGQQPTPLHPPSRVQLTGFEGWLRTQELLADSMGLSAQEHVAMEVSKCFSSALASDRTAVKELLHCCANTVAARSPPDAPTHPPRCLAT